MQENKLDYNKLNYLSNRIKGGNATKPEKDEYMYMLYHNGNITKQQYDNYTNSGALSTEELIQAGLVIGGVLLVAHLLSSIFKK